MGKGSRAQHVDVWEKRVGGFFWCVGKCSSCTQHVYVWEGIVGDNNRDVVDEKIRHYIVRVFCMCMQIDRAVLRTLITLSGCIAVRQRSTVAPVLADDV